MLIMFVAFVNTFIPTYKMASLSPVATEESDEDDRSHVPVEVISTSNVRSDTALSPIPNCNTPGPPSIDDLTHAWRKSLDDMSTGADNCFLMKVLAMSDSACIL